MRMALLIKFSFTSLGSACELKLELEIRQEKNVTAWNTDRDYMYEKGQVDLEGNGTLVEVNTMSAGAFLQPPEGLSRGPVPAEPVFKLGC